MHPVRRSSPWIAFALLALVAAVEISRLGSLNLNHDEVWHIWQTLGSPLEIVAWTPYDGTPLYPLLLAGWRVAVGLHPLALSSLSVLLTLIGASVCYRAGRRLAGETAGRISLLAYSALPYSLFLSGYVRPYALAQALVPVGFYLTLAYFEAERHRTSRFGVWLALVLAASFYTTLLAPLWIGAFVVFTLLTPPRSRTLARWLPVAIGFVILTAPILLARGAIVVGRSVERTGTAAAGLGDLSIDYFGAAWWVWGLLALVGLGAWLARRDRVRTVLGLLAWSLGLPLVLYLLDPYLGLFHSSYLFWSMTGAALLLGVTLSPLPRPASFAAAAVLAGLLFVPVSRRVEHSYGASATTTLLWMSRQIRTGEVLVIDPYFDCLQTFEWDYYTRALFPHGLRISEAAPADGTVWYALDVSHYDAGTAADVARGRIASLQTGDPDCRMVVFEAPPNLRGMTFDNGLIFHGAERVERLGDRSAPQEHPVAVREGETLSVRLWWSVLTPPATDYRVRLSVVDPSSRLLALSEGPPETDPPQTSRWEVGRYYIEERSLTMPYPLEPGSYELHLSLHAGGDQPGPALLEGSGASHLRLFLLWVRSW